MPHARSRGSKSLLRHPRTRQPASHEGRSAWYGAGPKDGPRRHMQMWSSASCFDPSFGLRSQQIRSLAAWPPHPPDAPESPDNPSAGSSGSPMLHLHHQLQVCSLPVRSRVQVSDHLKHGFSFTEREPRWQRYGLKAWQYSGKRSVHEQAWDAQALQGKHSVMDEKFHPSIAEAAAQCLCA